jgi:site-specific DNA-methyltransferase (cytosine-N4-specific)
MPNESISGIVTSPPYGDEHSTVNYTRYTKHAAFWLGFTLAEIKKGSQETLSSRKHKQLPTGITETEKVLEELRQAHELDSEKVVNFLSEFSQCLVDFQRVLEPGASCAIVIANRRVRQVNIPMDTVTSEIAACAGFAVENIYYRTFPKKVVAWTTISGSSMDQENIIVLRK